MKNYRSRFYRDSRVRCLYENEQEMLQKYMDEVMMELECERKNELNERCLEDSEEDNDSEIDYLEESQSTLRRMSGI
ncbi:hypothetical protein QE152_g26572 [Popillia japonica]|uniref:Uncharacterized protein n=1 Tax=Popillia japonica TaxID=7064 RepID=A0AAW1JYW8_POPJA